VKGFREADADKLAEKRPATGYRSVRDAWQRAEVPVAALERLAQADGWQSLSLDRRAALWQVRALGEAPLPLFAASEARALPGDNRPPIEAGDEPEVVLPQASLGERVIEDYRTLSLSLKAHPLALLRARLAASGIVPAEALANMQDGSPVRVAGLVLIRQRPGTASGIVFATLEDETGVANIVIWPALFERFRRPVLGARLLAVRGRLQREGLVTHVVGAHFTDLSAWLHDLLEREADHREDGIVDAIPEARNFR
jgi:error-prone DNA polymerase